MLISSPPTHIFQPGYIPSAYKLLVHGRMQDFFFFFFFSLKKKVGGREGGEV